VDEGNVDLLVNDAIAIRCGTRKLRSRGGTTRQGSTKPEPDTRRYERESKEVTKAFKQGEGKKKD
jgi:hypothetical protein